MRRLRSVTYAFHVIFRPFDGYWDLKREKRGSLTATWFFVGFTMLTLMMEKQNTGFLFNTNRLEDVDVIVEITTILLLFVLWNVSNWCLTSLMDGEGKMRDIIIATGYALFPLILLRLPMVVLSHIIIIDEGSFYYMISAVSYLWTGALLVLGTMVTHQYSMSKTLLTCFLTVVGMGIIIFIGLLFFSVIQQMTDFVTTVYKEVRFR